MHKTEPCIVLILIILTILSLANVPFATSQSTVNLININADGTIDPSTVPIQRNGNFYTLTGNISGGIAVHKSNILIDGAGYTLQGNGGTGIDLQNNVSQVPSLREIWNVTIKNLRIINFNFSVQTNGGGNNTFYNDYIANTISGMRGGIFLWGCGGNNITRCTISGEPAIFMDFVSSRNTITENNLSGGVWVELSGNETVDRNYWSDYLTKYPNATEVDSSGIGNTPYVFDSFGLVSGILQDNHPLMNPVSITVPEFPSWIILPLLIIVAIGVGLFVYFKKRKR